MRRMAASKDHSLLKDDEDWDVSVKKKPAVWKKWVRCIMFLFVTLLVVALILLFMCGFIYRHDFLGFIKLKPIIESMKSFVQPVSYVLIKERIHSGTVRMISKWFKDESTSQNTVWSPLTVSLCLGLLLEGAREQTAYEIKSTMGWLGIDKTDIRYHASRVMTRLNDLRGSDMAIANRMFLHSTYDVTSTYQNILGENYRASIDHVDFTNADALKNINKWGLEESRGEIKELMPFGSIDPTTKMVLSTILTFDGKWNFPFSPNYTQKANFTPTSGKKSPVDMMYQTGKFLYGTFPGHGFDALELPYSEPNISMIIILPKSIPRLKETLREQDGKILMNIRTKMTKVNVDICLPKFTIEENKPIERKLSSLGIRRLFNPSSANLDLMSPNSELYVQKIIHGVKIQVTESGTKGQASSSSILEGRSIVPSFCADQPFLFFVEDTETNSILFWGEYSVPE